MTFTYNGDPSASDTEAIRFYLQDTVEDAAIFSDEEIAFALTENSTVGATVISLIDQILAKLQHEPDGRADWLSVDWKRSSEYWMKLKDQYERRWGSSQKRTGSVKNTYRMDGGASSAPDYD